MSCGAAGIPCTYNTLSENKKKAHDNYILQKKQEEAQRLRVSFMQKLALNKKSGIQRSWGF